MRMLSVTTYDGQYVFSVTSNSTVSALVFNSTSTELAFSVTGEDGTKGFVDVAISEMLINDTSNLRVSLNGVNQTYTLTNENEAYLIHFEYDHSTHDITVLLGEPQESPPNPTPTPTPTSSPTPTPTSSPPPTPTATPTPTPTTEPEPTPTPTINPTPSPTPEPQPTEFPTTLLLGSVAIIGILVIVAFLIVKRKQ